MKSDVRVCRNTVLNQSKLSKFHSSLSRPWWESVVTQYSTNQHHSSFADQISFESISIFHLVASFRTFSYLKGFLAVVLLFLFFDVLCTILIQDILNTLKASTNFTLNKLSTDFFKNSSINNRYISERKLKLLKAILLFYIQFVSFLAFFKNDFIQIFSYQFWNEFWSNLGIRT